MSKRARYPKAAIALLGLALFAGMSVGGAAAATFHGLKSADLGAADGQVSDHPSGLSIIWKPVYTGTTWMLDGITMETESGDPFLTGERVKLSLLRADGTAVCEVVALRSGVPASVWNIDRSTIDSACGPGGLSFGSISRVALVSMSRS